MGALLKGIDESAEMLGISPWTIRHYLKIGRIKGVKIGSRHLIEVSELQEFINRCKGKSKQSSAPETDGIVRSE